MAQFCVVAQPDTHEAPQNAPGASGMVIALKNQLINHYVIRRCTQTMSSEFSFRIEAALEIFQTTIQDIENLNASRVAIDAFRQGGFFHVLRDRVSGWCANGVADACDRELLEEFDRALERRVSPGPRCLETATNVLMEERCSLEKIATLLKRRLEKATRQSRSETLLSIRKASEGFLAAVDRITAKGLPYIVRDRDPLLSNHGTIFLASQGLMIQMGAFSERLGLHKAYVAPGKSFAHIHSTDLADEPNWEFHYVCPGQRGSHMVGRYRRAMDETSGDIVGIPVNVAHGGTNHGDIPLELHFCAGGRVPWSYPPQDLLGCSVENAAPTADWSLVNGLPLESTLSRLAPGLHRLFDPAALGGRYGIELETLILDGGSFKIHGRGEVVHAWRGDGFIGVGDTAFTNHFSTGDKFALLAGIEYLVQAVTPLKLLIFRMKDFHH